METEIYMSQPLYNLKESNYFNIGLAEGVDIPPEVVNRAMARPDMGNDIKKLSKMVNWIETESWKTPEEPVEDK